MTARLPQLHRRALRLGVAALAATLPLAAFAGDLSTGQAPLHCDAQGRCQPPPIPLRVRVRMVAWAGFDARGLAATLPQSRLASGECLIERVEVRCDADLTESRALADPTSTARRWTAHGQRPL